MSYVTNSFIARVFELISNHLVIFRNIEALVMANKITSNLQKNRLNIITDLKV